MATNPVTKARLDRLQQRLYDAWDLVGKHEAELASARASVEYLLQQKADILREED